MADVAAPNPEALRSVFTSSLPDILSQLNISLVVSTYQAGKVVLVRCDSDNKTDSSPAGSINTHFRSFERPMGLASHENRLTIGGSNTVWEYRNVTGVAARLEPANKHDAAYLPRSIHITGDIDIHELAWSSSNELWLVNTKFSCLCTLDDDHSFVPRWRPPFVSALAPEDRCHLNGLAMHAGQPKWVTALGKTDTEGGWRANKANGGLLLDVDTSEVVLSGLSMPHSPRWYDDQLWVLESGEGTLAKVDLDSASWQAVAELPGFTRGIDFYGPLAFIGLSKVRESAVFSGLPIISRLKERTCGVWVVNIYSGDILGFLKFDEGVEEIFAVQVLRETAFPEMLEWGDPSIANSYVVPDEILSEVAQPTEASLATSPAWHFRHGMQLRVAKKFDEARNALLMCLQLQPEFPNARLQLGITLGALDKYAEAAAELEHVVNREPDRADARNSLGYIYACQARNQEAIASYTKAIELDPDFADAHFNMGLMQLKTGDYVNGWKEFEWRWKTKQFTPFQCPLPQWQGEDLKDKTILLHTEQGAGDAIQFARYIPLLADRGARIIIVCDDQLVPVFAAMPGISRISQPGKIDMSEFDTWLPLMSLPRVFETTLETIPQQTPYINVDTIRRRKDAAALTIPPSDRRKVGIVWRGSPTHANDRHRSCDLSALEPLLQREDVAYYSLQKGAARDELTGLSTDYTIHDLDATLQDYGDLMVVLDQLDLVIGVDTSVVHAAGALGKPVWTLISQSSDWRWGLTGDKTPWYPSMRLFRQVILDDWHGPVDAIMQAMDE